MRLAGLWAACTTLLLLLSAGVQAEVHSHPLSTLPPELEGVQTVAWFPEGSGKTFEAGKPTSVVLGIRNGGSDTLNVSAVGGSINSPFDFNYYVQNFTFQTYDVEVQPGQEVSVDYTVFPSGQLTPREFILCLTVFYKTGIYHSTTFFNGTVDIVEPQSWVDTQLLFLVLLGVLGVGLTVYLIYSYLADTEFFKRASKRPRAKVEVKKAPTDGSEWLKGTAHEQFTKAKAKRAETVKKAA